MAVVVVAAAAVVWVLPLWGLAVCLLGECQN